jgi:hypothetical protein
MITFKKFIFEQLDIFNTLNIKKSTDQVPLDFNLNDSQRSLFLTLFLKPFTKSLNIKKINDLSYQLFNKQGFSLLKIGIGKNNNAIYIQKDMYNHKIQKQVEELSNILLDKLKVINTKKSI